MGVKRLTQQSYYYQRLGAEYLTKTIIPDAHSQIQIRKYNSVLTREAFTHFMYDESGSISGGRIAIGLLKNNTSLDTADSCSYKIYRVSNDATPWVDTLVKSGTLSINSQKLFLTTLDDTEAGVDMDGDYTFKINARILKDNQAYYVQEYFNHIGITDTVSRLARKVQFLAITKRSFGE